MRDDKKYLPIYFFFAIFAEWDTIAVNTPNYMYDNRLNEVTDMLLR